VYGGNSQFVDGAIVKWTVLWSVDEIEIESLFKFFWSKVVVECA
jgi:hypothetical protein